MSNAPRQSAATNRPERERTARLAALDDEAAKAARNSIVVRNYMLFGFAGLLSMVPILLIKGLDLWCVFPLILGALSLMAHWRSGPIFVLLTLASIIVLRAKGYDPLTALEIVFQLIAEGVSLRGAGLSVAPQTPFLDLLLSVCVLVYVVGQYRMQAFVHHVIPLEARTQRPTSHRVKGQPEVLPINPRRLPELATRWEIPLLAAAILVCALAGDCACSYVMGLKPRFDMYRGGWQAFVVIWSLALLLLAAWTVFSYRARTRMTAEEGLLYLQDQIWRETRREQSRISRWLAWARLGYQRWKEQS